MMMGESQGGRVAVVTGATSGIGEAVARGLAADGARLVIVARDPARTEAALASLAPPADGEHHAVLADLSSLAEVKHAASEIAAREPVIDLLVNNAGAVFATRQVTPDGLEKTFALNHLAYLVMSLGLLPQLRAAEQARIVNTSSGMHARHGLDFSDLQMERGYEGFKAYARSKLCNILFTRALARRLAGAPVTVNAARPGFVATRFGEGDQGWRGVTLGALKRFALSPDEGARTILHLSTSPEVARASGGYFYKSRPATPSRAAMNDADAERLWAVSVELAEL